MTAATEARPDLAQFQQELRVEVDQLTRRLPIELDCRVLRGVRQSNHRTIWLELIYVYGEMQRSGVGSDTMRALCAFADQRAANIELVAYDGFGIPADVLIAFYTRFGFVAADPDRPQRLTRTPNPERTSPWPPSN